MKRRCRAAANRKWSQPDARQLTPRAERDRMTDLRLSLKIGHAIPRWWGEQYTWGDLVERLKHEPLEWEIDREWLSKMFEQSRRR